MRTFTGCGTALVTPFTTAGEVDERSLRRLVHRQVHAGIDLLVPCGTTGESPALTRQEHLRVVQLTIEAARGAVPVVAGAGGYNTAEVIELACELEEIGVDGLLSVTPYYNKPTQEGLYQHYRTIAEAVSLPIILYNVPGRTGVNIEPATVARLATIDNIVGVKEASGNIQQIARVLHEVPDDFTVLSGDDAVAIAAIALGARGLISVASNEIPAEMTAMVRAAMTDDMTTARQLHNSWFALMEINFAETSPIPVKAALAMMALIEPAWRLPLTPPSSATRDRIEAILRASGLLAPIRTRHAA
jgi:4-hydroxy-tetrahydrodipicolinate synthase